MINWQLDYDLTRYNSFGFTSHAERFISVTEIDELELALSDVEANNWPLLILGGGSNLVLKERIPGAVIHIANTGIAVLADDGEQAIVESAAGENWHQFIGHLLEKGLHGLENLALIPGSVGAAPVQNIGAYGVEVSDCLHSVTAYDRQNKELVQLQNASCEFSYRNSIFKSRFPGRYIIWSVRFNLSSIFTPQLDYSGLGNFLAGKGIEQPSAIEVYTAICEIRSSKLPVPSEIGNAGSFFENPIVDESEYRRLKEQFPELVAFPESMGRYKLAAGWLIDKAGWKGAKQNAVGVYDKQALVLVNHGDGNASQLLELADAIKQSVCERYQVSLRIEPRIYPI